MAGKKYPKAGRNLGEKPPERTGDPGEFRGDAARQRRILVEMRALKALTLRQRARGMSR